MNNLKKKEKESNPSSPSFNFSITKKKSDFGLGKTGDLSNELYSYDIKNKLWTKIKPKGETVSNRQYHNRYFFNLKFYFN
jgi:hypothetical protein